MPKSWFTIKLATLTPLWLGDIDADSATVKESGFIGSLRYWYEGLLRALGVKVCDAAGQRCQVNPCEACAFFGYTGRSRAFDLSLEGLTPVPVWFQMGEDKRVADYEWLEDLFQGRRALWGDPFLLRVRPVNMSETEVVNRLAAILEYATNWGGLGAKTQNGFGQIAIREFAGFDVRLTEGLETLRGIAQERVYKHGEFSLLSDRFFSRVYRFTGNPYGARDWDLLGPGNNDFCIPCAVDLKPLLRDHFPDPKDTQIFGCGGRDSRAGRIHVSHLYRTGEGGPYYLKIWGDVTDKPQACDAVERFVADRFGEDAQLERDY